MKDRASYLRFLEETQLPSDRELALRRILTDLQHEWIIYTIDRVRGGPHDAETKAALDRELVDINRRARQRIAAVLTEEERSVLYGHVTDLRTFVESRPFDVPESENILPNETFAGSPATPTATK